MILPQQLVLSAMQTKWAAILEPVLQLALLKGVSVEGVKLSTGNNSINHKLGRAPQGWFITDINAAASIYRSEPFNSLSLTLNSDAACTVNLYVY